LSNASVAARVFVVKCSSGNEACRVRLVHASQEFWKRLRELKLSCVQIHASAQPPSGPARHSLALRRSFDPRQSSVLRRYFDASQIALLTQLVSMLAAVSRLDIADVELNVPPEHRVQSMGTLTKPRLVILQACHEVMHYLSTQARLSCYQDVPLKRHHLTKLFFSVQAMPVCDSSTISPPQIQGWQQSVMD
jgi:hypothetical protein